MLLAIRSALRLPGSAAVHGNGVVPAGRAPRSGLRRVSVATVSGCVLLLACLLPGVLALAPSPAQAQSEGELRIVPLEADVPSTGRLEIFHTPAGGTGRWGPVCDDAFRLDEARVACKQMGYRGAEDYILRYSMTHAHTEAAYLVADFGKQTATASVRIP